MSFNRDPYKSDQFWIDETAEKLANPFISEDYRKRLEALNFDAKTRMDKRGTTRGHYPRAR